jgi:hypothetical protein
MRTLFRTMLLPSVLVAALSVAGCATVETNATPDTENAAQSGSAKSANKRESKSEAKKAKKVLKMTSGQKHALESAQNYLDMSGFSKKGLIKQLSSSAGEGFSKADATFAAKHAGANWKAEAVESAQNYLDMSGFSKKGLIKQLSS